MHRFGLWLAALAAAAPAARAVETRNWQQDSSAEFEKGTLKRMSLRSDGRLSLAPALRELHDTSTAYLWAVAQDSRGNLYAGGGGPGASAAKLFEIGRDGKARVLAEMPGMEIHAIAVDGKDRVFAATSPDGKVYRIAGGKAEVFYDPKAKYIWAMAFDSGGRLYVATGDQGEIHRVDGEGKGSVFFKTEETHARSLAVDAKDNLIAGTEPGGLIVRITPAGEGFVLYQAGKREITAVAVAKDGAIWAAGVGNKQPGLLPLAPPPPVAPIPSPAPGAAGAQPAQRQVPVAAAPPPTLVAGAPSISGGSEVYRVDTDGSPRRVWSDQTEVAYAIGFDSQGRPLIGTGNKGNVYRIDSDILSTMLLSVTPTQVTAFGSGREGSVFAVTGNVGKVLRIGPGLEKDGYYESEALDAGFFSHWGRLAVHHDANGGRVRVQTRSGNLDRPQKNWSPWADVPLAVDSGRIPSPPARFLQYRTTLEASASGVSPRVGSFDIAYLPKNVAPLIEQIETTPANYKFPSQSLTLSSSTPGSITLQPLGRTRRTTSSSSLVSSDSGSVSMSWAKGWVGARWAARDENGDSLCFKVEIRGEKEREWKLLKDKVSEKQYAWDSTAYPDGDYRLRITASDEPSNPPAQTLTNTLESDIFTIDNTPPQVTGLEASMGGSRLTAKWKAKDVLSVITKAEYSLDGGDWLVVDPVTRLSDSTELDYTLTLDAGKPGEHTLAVRVTDDYENQAVEKVVVR